MPSHVASLIRDWMTMHQLEHPQGLIFTTSTANYQGHAGFHDMWHATLDAIGLKPPADEDYNHFHALRGSRRAGRLPTAYPSRPSRNGWGTPTRAL